MVERTERRIHGSGVPASWGDNYKSEIILNNGSALIVLVEILNPLSNTEPAFHLLSCCTACGEPLVYLGIDDTGNNPNWACATKNGCGQVSAVSNVVSNTLDRSSIFLFIESRNTRAIEEWVARWLDVHPNWVEVDLEGLL